jgi:tRNA A37 threonylcarbamoyladenosine synthetase subunit TsaC/SUA5/YrdC
MERWGGPLISTSANREGEAASLTADEVRAAFSGGRGGDEIMIIDGGRSSSSVPSTLIDCMGELPILLRRGAIAAEVLRAAIPELIDNGR